MKGMKLRLLAMGSIISILSLALMATRGLQISFGGLFAIGLVLLVLGLFWKQSGKSRSELDR